MIGEAWNEPTVVIARPLLDSRVSLTDAFLDEGWTVVGSVDSSDSALALIEELLPDVAVIDVASAGDSTGPLCARISQQAPSTVVVLVCAAGSEATAFEGVVEGAFAVIGAERGDHEVVRAASGVRRGETLLLPEIARRVVATVQDLADRPDEHGPRLTATELEVLGRLADGWAPGAIAERHQVTERLVNLHPGYAVLKLQRLAFGRRVVESFGSRVYELDVIDAEAPAVGAF